MGKENGLEAAHFLLRKGLTYHATFYAVQVLVQAVEDAVGIGFYLSAEVRGDFVGAPTLVDVCGAC